ncbi:hypothetical protein ACVU7I_12515, partial [Patulibacter sp. S7RM1-6]
PANASRALGLARIAFGLATLAAPARVGAAWLGEAGTTPAATVALRGLAIREALVGMAQAHTADDPKRGFRWARTSAFGDLTDLLATLAVARELPRSGVAGTVAIAAGGAAASYGVSRWMRSAG